VKVSTFCQQYVVIQSVKSFSEIYVHRARYEFSKEFSV